MFATTNSSYCLSVGSCQPVAGYSAWASMPPLLVPGGSGTPTTQPLPGAAITLVLAQVRDE